MAIQLSYEQAKEWETQIIGSLPECLFTRNPTLQSRAIEYFASVRLVEWRGRVKNYHGPFDTAEWLQQRRSQEEGPSSGSLAKVRDTTEMEQPVHHLRQLRKSVTEFHGFMSLPRELRDMVYRHLVVTDAKRFGERICVARGKDFNQMVRIHDRCPNLWNNQLLGSNLPLLPCTGALRGVSRQFHLEASRVFFQNNRFILPGRDCSWPRFLNGEDPKNEFDVELKELTLSMRDVSYTFDAYIPTMKNNQGQFIGAFDHIPPPAVQEFLGRLHNSRNVSLQNRWTQKILAMREMRSLERLHIDLDECSCGFGCCRKVEWVLNTLTDSFKGPVNAEWCEKDFGGPCYQAPKVVEIGGWRNDEEMNTILERLELLKPIGMKAVHFQRASPKKKSDECILNNPGTP
ncbi:hypothetical protein PFICI_10621 [Pestalotiopsis fici W106-1]|uniref:F-box domain-containing protein n=1 Tax=Pestalotiopsis fici (strain W106-1 / CGMCC3.15140) TaxID=1229662 RepID=W3WXP2_PESFW|nr:uncharacterized protein PFICI_10621 [Pestalotiopsis fici W106-1]ETS78559.1 hypothetical protein PFICI_10621 [Pestalotiopsis fici W106-1]